MQAEKPPKNSITEKFNLLFFSLIILFSVFAWVNQITLYEYRSSYEKSVWRYFELVSSKSAMERSESSLRAYLESGNRVYLSEHNDEIYRFEQSLRRLRTLDEDGYAESFLRSIEDSFYSYQTACNYATFYYNHRDSYQTYLQIAQAENIGGYMQQYCSELLRQSILHNQEAYAAMRGRQGRWLFFNVVMLLALAGVFALSAAYFHFNLALPLDDLHRAAARIAAGERHVMIKQDYSERTVAVLSSAFNGMSVSISRMMESIREKAKIETTLLNEQLKNAEYEGLLEQANFLALQSQTNPHFLFNTLNSISRTITLGKSPEALLMIDALAALMRYSLSDADEPVLLAEELEVVRAYLKIQHYRFQERIRADIVCPAGLEQRVRLPRLTLQPLVENAVMHGLEPKPDGGKISLLVSVQGNFCVILLRDDGVGMTGEKCRALLSGSREKNSAKHRSIGVYNTHRRLRLFSQSKGGLTIHSAVGTGTEVRLTLPLAREEDLDVQASDCG